jgi:hypothetical protein
MKFYVEMLCFLFGNVLLLIHENEVPLAIYLIARLADLNLP